MFFLSFNFLYSPLNYVERWISEQSRITVTYGFRIYETVKSQLEKKGNWEINEMLFLKVKFSMSSTFVARQEQQGIFRYSWTRYNEMRCLSAATTKTCNARTKKWRKFVSSQQSMIGVVVVVDYLLFRGNNKRACGLRRSFHKILTAVNKVGHFLISILL